MPTLENGNVQIGSIIAWSGLLVDIPMGWQLCDNTNGTPNLIAKFIRGINTDTTDPGNMGGEDSVALEISEIASHNHGISDPGHTHIVGGNGPGAIGLSNFTSNAGTGGAISILSNTTGITVDNEGSGNSHENKPVFFELAYIMRLS